MLQILKAMHIKNCRIWTYFFNINRDSESFVRVHRGESLSKKPRSDHKWLTTGEPKQGPMWLTRELHKHERTKQVKKWLEDEHSFTESETIWTELRI